MRGAEIEATIYAWLNATYPAGPTWFDEEELPKDAPPLEVRMLCACNLIEYNIGNGGWSQFLWNCFDRWRTLINTAQEGYSLIGAKEQADALNILRELCERDEQACLAARRREDGSMETFVEYTRRSYLNRANEWEELFWGDIYERRLVWLEANESRVRAIIGRVDA
jgi:hypothetical protein